MMASTPTLRRTPSGPRPRPPRWLLATTAALATSLVAGASRAELPPWDSAVYCPDPTIAPTTDGRTVPGNTPAFPIVAESTNDGFELRTSAGELVPTRTDPSDSPGLVFLAPLSPLAEGTYAIRWRSSCKSSSTAGGTFSRAFVAGPSSPLPTKIGTMKRVRATLTYSADFCSDVQADTVVGVDLDPALKPFAETTWIGFDTDAYGYYGYYGFYGNAASGATGLVRAHCTMPAGFSAGVGLRTVRVGARLAGEPPLPPESLDVDIQCDPVIAADCLAAGSGGDAGLDANGADAAGAPAVSESGCTTGGRRKPASSALAGFLVGAGMFVARRLRANARASQ